MRLLTASTADDARCTEIVSRVMIAAAGRVGATITDADLARAAQDAAAERELVDFHVHQRETLAELQAKYSDLLERNAVLHDGAIGQKNEIIRLRAQLAEYGDRLGDYAGEVWARCPNCTGAEMAVTDGGEMAGAA